MRVKKDSSEGLNVLPYHHRLWWLLCGAVQVCMLLQRMGLDASDTRPVKKANLSGAELLLLSEQQLVTLLDVPLHKARRLLRLQVGPSATRLLIVPMLTCFKSITAAAVPESWCGSAVWQLSESIVEPCQHALY